MYKCVYVVILWEMCRSTAIILVVGKVFDLLACSIQVLLCYERNVIKEEESFFFPPLN